MRLDIVRTNSKQFNICVSVLLDTKCHYANVCKTTFLSFNPFMQEIAIYTNCHGHV